MNIKTDSSLYDTMHEGLLRGLFKSIEASLKEAQFSEEVVIPEEYLEGIVETVAFGVAAVIDGSAVMEHEGEEIKPQLLFEKEGELIRNDIGSYLHEMVMGYLDEYDLEEL